MALNSANVSPYQRGSQTFERRRSLFPQNSIDSGEDSDLGCMSPLSNSSFDEDEDFTNRNSTNNINDYDVIGIVKRDINSTPEVTPDKDWISHMSEQSKSSIDTPHFKKLESISGSVKSPNASNYILKTPHDTMSANCKLPKLVHKSITEPSFSAPTKRKLSPYNSPEFLDKSLKVDIKSSKVRTTLFPESDLFIPTKKFYSSSDSITDQQQEPKKDITMDQIKQKISLSCSSQTSKRRSSSKRNSTGKINAGVRHKIRKPKQRKNSSLSLLKSSMNETQSIALKSYLVNLRELKTGNSSGNKQILIEDKENISPAVSVVPASSMDICDYNSVSNDVVSNELNVKNGNTVSTMIEGATCLPQKSVYNNQFSVNFKSSDNCNANQPFTNPFTVTFSNKTQTTNFTTAGDELSKKRPLSPTLEEPDQSKKFFKFSRGHKGVVTMNQSIKLMVDHGKVSLLGGSTPKKTQEQVPDFECEDFAVEEPVMSQVVLDNILSSLDDENQSNVNESQKMNPIDSREFPNQVSTSNSNLVNPPLACHSASSTSINPANLILSPISQMCDVTSGLALDSPKRVKNLTPLMESMSRASKVLLSPKNNLNKKKSLSLAQKKIKKLHKDQMLLDAGQKKFGLTQCHECNFVYHLGDPSDEACHTSYHDAVPVLKFGGWKNERIVGDFQKKGRIILIKAGDPKLWLKRVSDLMEVVNREMGCYNMEFSLDNCQIFLYIKSRMIAGCLVAVQTSEGYRMLTTKAHESDLCSERSFPIKCGVARIWVSHNFRKQGIGTALMNTLKKNFLYGYILNNNEIAFSSPTEIGKAFAKKYFNTPNFMIYFP